MVTQNSHIGTALPGTGSQSLQERRRAAVSKAVGTVLPVYVAEASGGILRDVDGNQLIDFASGIAVTSVGNSDPRVVARVQEQVARFTHTCFMITAYESYVEVCEALNELSPGSHEKRSALFNSGAEAVENAIKIARYATGRQAVVAFDHAYHGRTNLTMALTAKNMPYKDGFAPFAGEIYRVPMAYPYRWPSGAERCADEAFETFVSQVHTQVGEQRTAAVILEPIQGEGGFVVPAPGFMARVAEWCREHGIVFIADEIQTGFCRTGNWFASEFEGVVPDLMTTGKAIAGVHRVHQVGAENVAALLIEPIQGEGGFVVPAPGFLPALREWATATGVVFVADEIQTGFGRTGAWFACEHEGIVPDLITTAKGIAGGLPLAAVPPSAPG